MDRITVTPVLWRAVSELLVSEHQNLQPLINALESLSGETVFQIRIPYGTTVIQDGRFCWNLLASHEFLKDAYCMTPIPLGIVLKRSVELFANLPPPSSHRVATSYLITAGEMFGLFENFAPNSLIQSALSASAGGTTLLVLPRMGSAGQIEAFSKALKWTCPTYIRENIKPTISSTLAFGEFFRHLVRVTNTEWYVDLVIFPFAFVEKIKENQVALLAITKATLAQMAVALGRAESTIPMLNASSNRPVQGDVISVRQIANGIRPGFAPVFGSPDDDHVLPAREIYEIIYGDSCGLFLNWHDGREPSINNVEGHRNGNSNVEKVFYPAVFRPALPDEVSYYFLRRPFAAQQEGIKAVARLTDVISELATQEPRARFIHGTRGELQSVLRADRPDNTAFSNVNVSLGQSYFIDGGFIRVIPRKVIGRP